MLLLLLQQQQLYRADHSCGSHVSSRAIDIPASHLQYVDVVNTALAVYKEPSFFETLSGNQFMEMLVKKRKCGAICSNPKNNNKTDEQ
jgi:hypothetical protein